jgi:Effector Associated Constant Component 1
MNVDIQVVSSQAVADLNDLLTWFQRDDEFTGAVHALAAPPRPGDLGPGVTQLLIATVTSAAAMQALARCVVSWIQGRGTRVDVRLTAANGRKIEISGADVRRMSVAQIQDLLAQADEMLRDDGE